MTLSTIYGRMRAGIRSWRSIVDLCRTRFAGFLIVVFGFSVSLSAAEPVKRVFNIEAKPATQSLTDYARQAHTQLGYDVNIVDDILTNAVVGEYDTAEALELLLEDTGLEAEHGERGIFIRRVPESESGGGVKERKPAVAETNGLQVVQSLAAVVSQAAVDQEQTSRSTDADGGDDLDKQFIEEIVVTGTNIRGIAPESSPVRIYDREDIQISGAATAQDFVQTLTENFGGSANESIPSSLPDDSDVGFNTNSGSFGSGVNLRGLGAGSTLVLLNGHRMAPSSEIGFFVDISMIPASALERIEVLSDGGSSIYGSDAVAGVVNFILRDDYEGAEASVRYGSVTDGNRDEIRANLTGGKTWDAGNALFVYEFLDQSNLSATERSFSQGGTLPNDLLPSQERQSMLLSASQELTPQTELFADLLISEREAAHWRSSPSFDPTLRNADAQSLNASLGATWNVSNDWYLDISGNFSRLEQHRVEQRMESVVVEDDIDADVWTSDIRASGTVFSMPGGNVKLAIGGHYRKEDFSSFNGSTNMIDRDAEREVYATFGEVFIPIFGPENAVSGIARFEVNLSGRFEDYSDFGSTADPKVGVLWSPFKGLNLRGSYGTSFKAPPLGRVNAVDFAAISFPSAFFNDIFGLTPADPSIADIVVLSVQGTAKDIGPENATTFTGGFDFVNEWGRNQFRASATYFDIDFEDRLGGSPCPGCVNGFDAINVAFNDPSVFPPGTITLFPSIEEIEDILESADQIFDGFADPLDAEAISRLSVIRNLARSVVRGFDFEISYSYEADVGRYSFGLNGSYLMDFKRQAAVTTPLVELVNTRYNPVDLNLRGRMAFSSGAFVANAFFNYTDSYRTDDSPNAIPVESWTTIDLTLSYDTQDRFGNPFLDNTSFRLSVLNLLDEEPPSVPSVPSLSIFGYDPTNASPLKRFVAIELTKRF